MIAVFGLKTEFEKFRADNKASKHLYKLVTDNIEQDFCGYNVEELIFLGEFTQGYPNLQKTYIKVMSYVRGPRCDRALQQLKQLLEIEATVTRIRRDMTKVVLEYNTAGLKQHQTENKIGA